MAWAPRAHAQTGWFITRHGSASPIAGKLDGQFGTGGVLQGNLSDPTSTDVLLDIKESPFGGNEIVAGGYFAPTSSNPNAIILSRFDRFGQPDNSFGFFGVSSAQARPGGDEMVWAIAFQRSFQIIAAGVTVGSDNVARTFVGRFNWNGVLDTTFGDAGTGFFLDFRTPLSGRGARLTVADVKVLSDDSIILVADLGDRLGIAKYTSRGVRASYGPTGSGTLVQGCGAGCFITNAAVDWADGTLVTGFRDAAGGTAEGLVMRVTKDGRMDPGFGTSGIRVLPQARSSWDVAVDTRDRSKIGIIVASQMNDGQVGLQLLNTSATVQHFRPFTFQGQTSQSPHGIRLSGGKAFVSAQTFDNSANPGGIGVASVLLDSFVLDNSFGTSGRTVTKIPFGSVFPSGFSVDSAGKLLTCGRIE